MSQILNQSDNQYIQSLQYIQVSDDSSQDINVYPAKNFSIIMGKNSSIYINTHGYTNYYGQSIIKLTAIKSAKVYLNNKGVSSAFCQDVDNIQNLQAGKVYILSVKFFGNYARIYIIDCM